MVRFVRIVAVLLADAFWLVLPDPPNATSVIPKSEFRHRMAAGALVLTKSVLGLHHEYSRATRSCVEKLSPRNGGDHLCHQAKLRG
jgi:hypothetical protein